ncbi:hypothetical protein [Entomospira culicis]|uniref:Uncharacterized protein n=1 Tax=Entomospira culicis TaxID=2719989 RepID=A0A968GJH9_9SPIO|nr:hypothetical protein [Entomospira culicis]NIZ19948.1 hypothetical protein [Entomospira culicis]NIZ70187.1 hypothetical protein [Entomospira culicis]WDI38020.1 hypothetical protein PVA46_08200 [Entomospira culicis]WDI39643.1 hypothetical protein PVA47_08200 [Entomospira culicis]
MRGWWVLALILTLIVLLIGSYLLLWGASTLRVYYRLLRQGRRKRWVWEHYQEEQKRLVMQDVPPASLPVLRTFRAWSVGEESYFMMQHALWCSLSVADLLENKDSALMPLRVFGFSEALLEEERDLLPEAALTGHLFITNHRLLFVLDQEEKSLFHRDIDAINFYMDTIELAIKGERLLIHGYAQPEVMIQCYSLLAYFHDRLPSSQG